MALFSALNQSKSRIHKGIFFFSFLELLISGVLEISAKADFRATSFFLC